MGTDCDVIVHTVTGVHSEGDGGREDVRWSLVVSN